MMKIQLNNKKINKESLKDEFFNINKNTLFICIAVILIAIFCIALTPKTLQNDTYYTIKIGEYIEEHGIDMSVEPFSWHEGLGYTYPHWLYDLITYKIYSLFNMDGIYVVTCILSVILGISVYAVNSKLTKNKVTSFVLTILSMYVIKDYIAARAQLVTFILFVWEVYFIEKFLETKKWRYALYLIAIPIAIANLHAAVFPFYFVLYLPYIAEYLLEVFADVVFLDKISIAVLQFRIKKLLKKNDSSEDLQKLQNRLNEKQVKSEKIKIRRCKDLESPYKIKTVKNPNVKWLILIMIICIFTGLLTPIGDTPYTYLIKTMQGNTTQNINEHLPMTLANNTNMMCALVLVLALLTFTKVKIRMSDLFMIGGLAYLMFLTKRQETLFTLIGVIIFNRMLNSLIQMYNDDKGIKQLLDEMTSKVVLIITSAIILIWSYTYFYKKIDDEYVSKSEYPVEACDFILKNIDLETARFYNEYNYGSYMLYIGIPVFIDSRADVYDPQFTKLSDDIFSDFINTSNIGTFYEDTFEKYGITHVITYRNSKTNMIITKTKDANYKELYSDNYFVIYERLSANNDTEETKKIDENELVINVD